MAGADTRRPGALVVSLDFELAWGVRERLADGYAANLYGSRLAIPRLLALFEEYEIAATWATVGLLFARSREEMAAFSPSEESRPRYSEAALDAYAEPVGSGEDEDPLHFAPSLIERIRRTPRQELATHTFSHYYTTAPGHSAESFRADLEAARAIAAERGIEISSIVFPRNQHNAAYDGVLFDVGIRAYRGTPRSWMWGRDRWQGGNARGRRAARLLDSYANLSGHGAYRWTEVPQSSGLSDVRASAFLRPFPPRHPGRHALVLRRIRNSLRAAARRGEIFHLWWHPHNHGRDLEENLQGLRGILDEFARLRETRGMRSLSMAGVDAIVRGADLQQNIPTEEACA